MRMETQSMRVKRTIATGLVLLVIGVALTRAAGPHDVADAAMRGDMAAVRKLITEKVDVNAPQPDGATALQWAVYRGDKAMLEVLLGAGANVKAANREGSTPMWLRAGSGEPGKLASPILLREHTKEPQPP